MLTSSLLVTAPVAAQSSGSGMLVPEVQVDELCTPLDPMLTELSGLAAVGDTVYGIGDSGTDEAVVALDGDCTVTGTIPVPVDPYDIEDLGVGPDGRLWFADIGDNQRVRPTVALISLDPQSGDGGLHRLTYPDGARDAEALLIQRDGVPLIVTKSVLAPSGIYRPAGGQGLGDLQSPGPTALEQVGTVRLGPTDTPGGPIPVGGSTLITGGAVSSDGTVAALRTYTDVYLYDAPDGDLVRALTTAVPVRVPIPNDPQGEAIAFTVDGDLLVGSEAAGGPMPPLRIVRGAVELAASGTGGSGSAVPLSTLVPDPARADPAAQSPAAPSTSEDSRSSSWATVALLGGAAAAGCGSYLLVRRRSR